jgi:RecJ-like exonuclease
VAAAGKVFLPTDLDALRPLVGQPITIEGRLVRLGGNKGQTIRYLNFTQNYRDSVALVFFVSKGGDAFAKDKLTEWLGKKVRATGKLADFNGNLQIEVENLDQLQEIAETPPPAAAAAKTL